MSTCAWQPLANVIMHVFLMGLNIRAARLLQAVGLCEKVLCEFLRMHLDFGLFLVEAAYRAHVITVWSWCCQVQGLAGIMHVMRIQRESC